MLHCPPKTPVKPTTCEATLYEYHPQCLSEKQQWWLRTKGEQKTTSAVCAWSSDSCLVLSLLDWLPWQGPWGGQPWRFSGPPPRHRSGHRGVKADQSGTPNQISHLSPEALGQPCCFPTGSLQLSSPRKCSSYSFYIEAGWKSVTGSHITPARIICLSWLDSSFHKLMFAD